MGEQQNGQEAGQEQAPAFEPITSQEDLNRIIGERVQRERAKFADYRDLKAKAARLDELEAANKSETQKLTEAMAAAERDRDQARAEALRLRVATKHGITDTEDVDLFLTGTDEETLTRQAERLAERAEGRKRSNHVPREGTHSRSAGNDDRAFVRELFGSGG